MTETTVRKRAEEPERIPVTIIPMRTVLERGQEAELRTALQAVRGEMGLIGGYSTSIRTNPENSAAVISPWASQLLKAIGKAREAHIPVVAEWWFRDAATVIQKDIDNARKEGEAGRFGAAVDMLARAEARLKNLETVLEIEVNVLSSGVPSNVNERLFESFLNGIGISLRDMGTRNQARGEAILHVASLYADNVQLYNTNDISVMKERDGVFTFVAERSEQASKGMDYTEKQESDDKLTLSSFDRNLKEMARQVRMSNIDFFDDAIRRVDSLMALAATEQNRKKMAELRDSMEEVLDKLRKGREIDALLMRDITTRYMLISGRSALAGDEQAAADIAALAGQLKGTKREAADNSPGWFGAQALIALDRGDIQMAALAVSLGMLQRSAASMKKQSSDYVPEYQAMHDAMANGRTATPAMMDSFSSQVDIASMALESEGLAAEYGAGKGDSSRRVASAANEAMSRLRADNPDVEGAGRLFKMALSYADLLKAGKGKPWAGMEDMEKAIDDELKARDGSVRFGNALAYYRTTMEADGMLDAIRWGKEMEPRLGILTDALGRAKTLASQGKTEEAGKVLWLSASYADSVGRLGEMRNGRIVSVRNEELLGGMESTLKAVASGNAPAEDTFMKSYTAAQASYVGREAERLGKLAAKRQMGGEEINAALATAVKKTAEGDIIVANTILQYVADYYGQAGEGRAEGWRYSQFATESGKKGRTEMLQAIRMAMAARNVAELKAAAQRFDMGTGTVASLQTYREMGLDARMIGDAYYGRRPLATGLQPGQVPVGQRKEDGTYSGTTSMESVRRYEAENPKDATLRGDTLTTIMDKLESAAYRGDAGEYGKLRNAFWERFALVASRAYRKQTIEETRGLITQVQQSMHESLRLYRSDGETQKAIAVERLQKKGAELMAALAGSERSNAELPLGDVATFLADAQNERRVAAGYGQVHSEMGSNQAFMGRLSGPAGSLAKNELIAANKELDAAGKAMLKGDWTTAAMAYDSAILNTITAMEMYEEKEPGKPRRGYDTYRTLRLSALYGIVKGDQSQEKIEKMLRGARLIEASVLTIPAHEASQVFTNYAGMQRRVKELVWKGDMIAAGEAVTEMQKLVMDKKFWANIGVGATGLIVSVIPGGQLAGAAIFASLSWDQILTEYREKGSASWTSWAMLAAVPLTMGAVSMASRFGAAAIRAEEAGATSYAARLGALSRGLRYGALGVGLGFSGYMGYEAVEMFRAGENAKGVALAAMGLFPFAYAAGSGVMRGPALRVTGKAEARADMESVLDVAAGEGAARVSIEPTKAPSVRTAEELQRPQELFSFLKELAAADKKTRDNLLTPLPKTMRPRMEALLKDGRVRKAIDAQRLEPDELSMRVLLKAIEGFAPKPSGPSGGGPRGRRWEIEAAGLVEGNRLAELLKGLLTPARARAENPAAMARYADAKRTVETIRAESPEIASVVEGLTKNVKVTDYAQGGRITRDVSNALAQANANITDVLLRVAPEAVPARQQIAVGEGPVSAVGRMLGEAPKGEAEVAGMPRFRAQATTPPGGTAGGPAPGGPTAVPGPAPGAAAPTQAQPSGFGKLLAPIKKAVGMKTGPAAEEMVVPGMEEVADRAGAALENVLETQPDKTAEIVKALYREALETKDNRYWTVLRHIYSKQNVTDAQGNVTNKLQARAAGDSELAKAVLKIVTSTEKAAADEGVRIRPHEYMAARAIEPVEGNDAKFIMEACGRDASRIASKRKISIDAVQEVQNLFDMNFTPTEKAAVVLRFEEIKAVGPARVMGESIAATARSQALINNLPTSGNPIVDAVRQSIIRHVAPDGNLETTMLNALKSNEVARAVENVHGRGTGKAFKEAMNVGTVDAALGVMDSSLRPGMEAMWNTAKMMPDLMEELSILGAVKVRANQVLGAVDETGSTLARQAHPILYTIWDAAKVVGGFLNNVEPFTNWGGRTWLKGIAGAIPGGRIRAAASNWMYIVPQVAAWWALNHWGSPYAIGFYRTLTGAATVEEGRKMCKERYGIACSDENARWITKTGLSAQAELRTTVHETIVDVKDDILDGIGKTLKGNRMQDVVTALENAEKKLMGQVAEKDSDKQKKNIRQIFTDLKKEMAERIGGSITLKQQAEIEKIMADAENELVKEFKEALGAEKPRKNDGAALFRYIVNTFPQGDERRPDDWTEVRALLDRGVLYDIRKIDKILTDGHAMSDALDGINELLVDRKTKTKANDISGVIDIEKKLREKLEPLHIELGNVYGLLSGENKNQLDITDMANLRRKNWMERGLVLTYMDVAAETFLADTGTIGRQEVLGGQLKQESMKAESLLRWYPAVYWFMFDSVRAGNIPSVFVGDVMANLSKTGPDGKPVIEGLRQQATATKTIDVVLREHLKNAGFYIEVSGREGIKDNSFLGMLDQNAITNPGIKQDVKAILYNQRWHTENLAAFNSFALNKITIGEDGMISGGETVYGKPEDLAKFITNVSNLRATMADVAQTAAARAAAKAELITLGALTAEGTEVDIVAVAMKQGRVGPAALAEIDPELLKPGNERLVAFAVQRTTRDRNRNAESGLIKWLVDNKRAIKGNVVNILKSLQEQGTVVPKDPAKIEKFLDGQADYYKNEEAWWDISIPTPSARRKGEEKPLEKEKGMEEIVLGELKPKPVRLPGYNRVAKPGEAPPVVLSGMADTVMRVQAQIVVTNHYAMKEKSPERGMMKTLYPLPDDRARFEADVYAEIKRQVGDPKLRKTLAENGIAVTDKNGAVDVVMVTDSHKANPYLMTMGLDILKRQMKKGE